MRRHLLLATAGLVAVSGFGLLGAAGPAGASSGAGPAAQHIKPGQQWTFEASGCEILTFSANGTFKADLLNDRGSYTAGGPAIKLKWTKGAEKGATFVGAYQRSTKTFTGTLKDNGSTSSSQLVKGVVPTFNLTTC
jgi:hypothetical protein